MKEATCERLPVTQKHVSGCAVACMTYILNISYAGALKLFRKPEQAVDRGFLCREIVEALQSRELDYVHGKVLEHRKKLLQTPFFNWKNSFLSARVFMQS